MQKDIYIDGQVVVGFQKEASQQQAETLLNELGYKYEKTDSINLGKEFFYSTGHKYIVYVKKGDENKVADKLLSSKLVLTAQRHPDSSKVLID